MQFKVLFLVLIGLFVVSSLTAPIAIGPTNDTTVVPEYSDDDEPYLGIISSIVMSDGTVVEAGGLDPVLGSTMEEKSAATVVITMDTNRTHVGCTVSRDLGKELGDILNDLCDKDAAKGIPGQVCKTSEERYIENIVWSEGSNDWLTVTIESSWIPDAPGSNDNTAILTLFQDQIVHTFTNSIRTPKNRYQFLHDQSYGQPCMFCKPFYKCYEFANSADFYEMAITGLPGNNRPHLRVRTAYSRTTEEGVFDCKGALEYAWNALKPKRIGQYSRNLDVPMKGAINCGDKDGKGRPDGKCGDGPKRFGYFKCNTKAEECHDLFT